MRLHTLIDIPLLTAAYLPPPACRYKLQTPSMSDPKYCSIKTYLKIDDIYRSANKYETPLGRRGWVVELDFAWVAFRNRTVKAISDL